MNTDDNPFLGATAVQQRTPTRVYVLIALLLVGCCTGLGVLWIMTQTRPAQTVQSVQAPQPVQPVPQAPRNDEILLVQKELQGDLTAISMMVVKLQDRVQELEDRLRATTQTTQTTKKIQDPVPRENPKAKMLVSSSTNKKDDVLADWDVIGFSGTRVVISNAEGSHFLRIGQSLDGVTIQDIDSDTGTITTSHGKLRYR